MKKIVSVLLLSIVALTTNAQENDPVLLTIGGKEVKLSEFNAIFNKNKTEEKSTAEAVDEYLDLYIKFKLKVREAEELGYDTLPKFINELKGYRKQLAQPYMTDKEVTESLIKEAYERMKHDVKASHILIMLDAEAMGTDTVEAYAKISKARKRVLSGEPFDKVAKELSEDPSAKNNGGNLGYFSALHMVYPFESAAYITEVGKVSKPVRSKFGYHIVKVEDKRPARGTIKVAHIMVKTGDNDAGNTSDGTEKQKIFEIYEKIKAGEDFGALAKQFSDDKNSAKRGGELPEFNAGKMVAEFEEASFALKNDSDFSEPFKTQYGWHIVKRLGLKNLEEYDVIYNTLKAKVGRDSRSNKTMVSLLAKIKAENNFKENIKERNDFYKLISMEEFKTGTWKAEKANKYSKVMFGFYAPDGEKKEYTQTDFANRIERQRVGDPNKKINLKSEINKVYREEVKKAALDFKDSRLSKTNEDFRLLMNEYRDGILLFDLTDEKVWSKAVKDSAGLYSFYEKNKNNYMWGKRVDATIYSCSDEAVAKKVQKILKKKVKKGYTNKQILDMVNTDSQLALNIENDKYSKGDNESIDKAIWEENTKSTFNTDNGTVIVEVNKVLGPEPKALEDIKGLITSDYQNHLEKEWVKELKKKYKVEVKQEVLKLVK
jgi:peptidyl-prolyl cis-trans isomerase SurA